MVFGGFCGFFCGFLEGFVDFYVVFVLFLKIEWVLREIGLLSFGIRACIGLGSCSLCEVDLVGPETRILFTFVVGALF